MGLQSVLFLLVYGILPCVLGALHLLHLRIAWGLLILISGAFTFGFFMGWMHIPKSFGTLWFSFLSVLAIGAVKQGKMGRNERIGHAIYGTATVCMTMVLVFDLLNLRLSVLSDDSTGLIAGIIASAILFGKSRRR